MARENKTKYAILGVLSMGPMSGYDINKIFQERLNYVWSESYGQLYPMLKRMEQEELIEKCAGNQEGRIDRKVYQLTEKGLDEFREWHPRTIGYQITRKELLLKLIFGSKVQLKDNIAHVEHFREMIRESLKLHAVVESEYASRQGDPDARFKYMATRYYWYEWQALLAWCDETLDALRKMENQQRRQT